MMHLRFHSRPQLSSRSSIHIISIISILPTLRMYIPSLGYLFHLRSCAFATTGQGKNLSNSSGIVELTSLSPGMASCVASVVWLVDLMILLASLVASFVAVMGKLHCRSLMACRMCTAGLYVLLSTHIPHSMLAKLCFSLIGMPLAWYYPLFPPGFVVAEGQNPIRTYAIHFPTKARKDRIFMTGSGFTGGLFCNYSYNGSSSTIYFHMENNLRVSVRRLSTNTNRISSRRCPPFLKSTSHFPLRQALFKET